MNSIHSLRILLIGFLSVLAPSVIAATDAEISAMIDNRQFESALTAVDSALDDPERDSNQLMLVKGFLLIQLGQLQDAEVIYDDLSSALPNNVEVSNNLGVVYQLQNRYPEALQQFQKTIDAFPEFPRAYENLGDTYLRMALSAWNTGIEAAPDDGMLQTKANLGRQFNAIARNQIAQQTQSEGSGSDEVQQTTNSSDSPSSASTMEQQLVIFLRSWIDGWTSKNPNLYFAHYSDEFKPQNQPNLEAWIARKTRIINKAEYIDIELTDVEFQTTSRDSVTVAFTQEYESDTYSGTDKKQLDLKIYDGRWLIMAER
ncbi:MAG: tetratricopeptide repeat protein [Pseudomonadota bacterium]